MAARSRSQARSQTKCGCNIGYMILAIIFITLGIYSLVSGFLSQWKGYDLNMTLGWYFISVILFMIGKMSKWKAYSACTVHSMK